MNKPLRSLSGLIDFECAARWGSFKLAAQELNKTPAAVSQQIKQLEVVLGFALFVRHARHLSVTDKGRELAAVLARNLRELNAKIMALQEDDEESVLRISTTHSFAMKWLVPRLYRFTEQHPELDIRIDSNDQIVDLASSCDVAIRHHSYRAEEQGALLLRDQLVVVYSPALLKPKARTKNPVAPTLVALSKYPLLYDGSTECWLRLLKDNRIRNKHYDFSRSYSHSGLLVQASVAAHGVALAPYSVAYADILKGNLLVFPCKPLMSSYCYSFLSDDHSARMSKVILFREWIIAEIEEMDRFFSLQFE